MFDKLRLDSNQPSSDSETAVRSMMVEDELRKSKIAMRLGDFKAAEMALRDAEGILDMPRLAEWPQSEPPTEIHQ